MKRFYTREHYLRLIDDLRDARSDLVLSTDFIIGFPGETDQDFEQTMSLLDTVASQSSFSFKYSPRPGTPALRLMERGPVDPEVAQARLMRLQERQREIALQVHRSMEGSTYAVLVEGPSRHDHGVICGRTSTFKTINFPGGSEEVGRTIPVTVTRAFTNSLRGVRAGTTLGPLL